MPKIANGVSGTFRCHISSITSKAMMKCRGLEVSDLPTDYENSRIVRTTRTRVTEKASAENT